MCKALRENLKAQACPLMRAHTHTLSQNIKYKIYFWIFWQLEQKQK